jgi:pimeloyl-ACP methyl ester carboxylesterase
MRALLQRFAERHLDQFENLRFDTSYGPVFVLMTRELPPGWPPGAFTAMPRPAPGETRRFAHVSDPASATSREDVLRVIAEMQDDLAGTGAREWENPNLERFLDALGGFLDGLNDYYANRGQQPSGQARSRARWQPEST